MMRHAAMIDRRCGGFALDQVVLSDTEQVLGRARALHQAGRLEEAEGLYRQILARDRDHADALHLLGVIAHQRGEDRLAVELVGQAIARNDRVADFYCNLGSALGALGRLNEAEAQYRRAIELNPQHAESHNNLGNALKEQGRLDEAERQLRKALDLRPGYAEAQYNLGNVLLDRGSLDEAVVHYRRATSLKPGFANAHYNLGHALKEQGKLADAAESYRGAVALKPGWADANYKRGAILHALNRLSEAESCFRRAHETDPSRIDGLNEWAEILDQLGRDVEAVPVRQTLCRLAPQRATHWFDLGLSLQRLRRPAEAREAYLRAKELDAEYPYALNNLAAIEIDLDRPQEAIEILEPLVRGERADALAWINLGSAYRGTFDLEHSVHAFERAIALAPNNPLAHSNYGLTLKELGRWNDAQAMFDRALKVDPGFVGARWNLAMAQLVRGDYAQGLINHEARWEGSPELRGKPRGGLKQPLWEGEPLTGKTLFVWGEQGFGDALQFARYVPLIAERVKRDGGRMIYCCFRPLLALFHRSFAAHVGEIIPDNFWPLPDFDYHCPLASLPLRFGTMLDTIPQQTPYLALNRDKVDAWRVRLSDERRLKVALVWSGKPSHQRNQFRSVGLQAYAAAFKDLSNAAFYSLQFDAADEIEQARANGFAVVDYTPEMRDYDDSAAFARNMDLIITVCTSTAHLAGAIAASTWVLLDVNPHWIWLLDRSDSPWYPTVTLYRQTRYREWPPVLARVAADLAKLAEQQVACMSATTCGVGGEGDSGYRFAHSSDQNLDIGQAMARATASHQAGALAEAEHLCRSIVEVDPNHEDSLHLLGVVRHQLGWHDEAVKLIGRAIARNARSADLHCDIGLAHGAAGRRDAAITHYETAIALEPRHALAHNNLGNALVDQGRLAEGEAQLKRAVQLKPVYPEGHYNLANALAAQGKLNEAAAHYQRALEFAPNFANANNNLGIVFEKQGRLEEAAAQFRRALELEPQHASANYNFANLLKAKGDYAAAIAHYERSLATRPGFADTWNNMGASFAERGDLDAARRAYEKAVEAEPTRAAYHRNLANSKRFEPGEPQLAVLEELMRNPHTVPEPERIDLQFTLGKAYADLKQHERSFEHLLAGNAEKRRQIVYDEAAAIDSMRRIRTVFDAELVRAKAGAGDPAPTPVFVVGMPRSGTTLIEQIIASHPEAFGAGELHDLDNVVRSLAGLKSALGFPEVVAAMSGEELRQLGARYVAAIGAIAPKAQRIADKMPWNFHFCGLIHLALPNARIIHARRDPVDTCLSCFSILFDGDNNRYTYDLSELGRFYRAYDALMAHWRSVLPAGVMLEVQYEEVVGDLEAEARRIIAHCGLDWDDRCLAFHETLRPVRTSSVAQVRQPIYQTSIGRWRPYRRQLVPLLEALGIDAASP
jgi:tetratricopeptide (TPR) repeat protein